MSSDNDLPAPDSSPVVPATPVRSASLVVIASILTIAAVTYLGPILKPFLIAVFLYYMLKPAAEWIMKFGVSRLFAFFLLFAFTVAGFTVVARYGAESFADLGANWGEYKERITERFQKLTGEDRKALAEVVQFDLESASKVFATAVHFFNTAVLVFFYLLFILLSVGRLPERVRRSLPPAKAEHLLAVGQRISAAMEQFLKMKTIASLGLGLNVAIVLVLFKVDYWLLWACLFFAFNYITYIGSIAACVPPIIQIFMQFDNPYKAFAVSALVVAVRFLWVDFFEIRLAGKHLKVDAILMFLWLAYWGWVWGIVGLVLAIPMITGLRIVLENIDGAGHWGRLMSGD